MATVTVTAPIVDGVLVHAADVDAIVSTATVTGIVNADLAASMKDGTAGTATARSLGTGATQAAAGNDARLSDARSANGLKFGANTAIPLDSSNPGANTYLKFDGTKIVGDTPSSTAGITGTGTVDTTAASPTVIGTSTKFLTELRVGYIITVGTVSWRIIAIASDTSLTVNANWGANNAGQAYTYIISSQPRPWNDKTAKSSSFSVGVTDAGQLFAVDTSGAAVTATLVAANGFIVGDSVAFVKTTDDANALTVTCAGADSFTDGSTSKVVSSIGGAVTIVTDGVSKWRVVSELRAAAAQLIQNTRKTDTAQQSVTTVLALTVAPTTVNTHLITPLSATITPKSAVSNIRVRAIITGANNNDGQFNCFAIFSTVAATPTLRQVGVEGTPQGGKVKQTVIQTVFTSATTAAMTIDLGIAVTAGTYYYLGSQTGASLYAGTVATSLEVWEEAL